MSIFDDQEPVGHEVNTSDDSQPNFLDKLVGEGKKFKTVEELAKGKAEADSFIEAMKLENEELVKKQQEQDYAKSLLDQIKEKATVVPVTPEPKNTDTTGEEHTTPNPEDVESLVNEVLTKREKEQASQSNLKEVKDRLINLYGTEAKAKVEEKARSLGVDTSYLDEMAAKSPSSFFAIMGEAPKASPNPIITGTGNTSTMQGTERDSAYYYKMYKENRNLWKSPTIQKQMVEDKNKLGARYFK